MTEQLLLEARLQAEASEPPVRAAALLRIARVLTKINQAKAERLLDRGLALLAELPEEDRSAIAPQAICLAACVAPDRAFALLATTPDSLHTEKFLYDMVGHGHAATAVRYLTRWSEEGEFPYGAAQNTMCDAKDDDTRRDILRAGLRAWHRRRDTPWHSTTSLLQLFRFYWRLLPEDEARDEIRRIVAIVRTQRDERLNGSFGGLRATVTFSSQRPSVLFQLVGPLKQLDPELAEAVIRESSELAAAVDVYPHGADTDNDLPPDLPPELPSAEALEQWQKDWTGFALGSRFFRMEDEQKSDFRDSFDHALRAFARDTDQKRPNAAPRECWPSAEDFRTILYAVGRYEGVGGARLLDRIPDPALRLFARIELAAGTARLDQIGGITREQL